MTSVAVPPVTRASLAYLVYFVAIGASSPYVPVYFRGLGLDLGTIGLIAALSATVQLLAAPAWGTLADAFPRARWTLPLAAAIGATAALALSAADGMPAIVACVIVLAIGTAGIGPILDARTLDLVGPDRNRYGRVRAVGSFSFVVSAVAVGLILDRGGAPALFSVYVPALVVTMLVAITLPRRPAAHRRPGLGGARDLLRRRDVSLFLVGALMTWTTVSAVNGFFSIQLVALGAPAHAVGLAWAVGAMVEVPLMWTFPALAGRFGTERLLVAGACGFAVRTAVYAILRDPVLLIAANAISGFSFALLLTGGVTFISHRVPRALAATGQGLHASMTAMASILGSGLGGIGAAALTIRGMYGVCVVVCAISAIVVAHAVRTRAPLGDAGDEVVLVPTALEEGWL